MAASASCCLRWLSVSHAASFAISACGASNAASRPNAMNRVFISVALRRDDPQVAAFVVDAGALHQGLQQAVGSGGLAGALAFLLHPPLLAYGGSGPLRNDVQCLRGTALYQQAFRFVAIGLVVGLAVRQGAGIRVRFLSQQTKGAPGTRGVRDS